MKKLIPLFILILIGGSLNCQNLQENIPVEEKIQKLSILWKEGKTDWVTSELDNKANQTRQKPFKFFEKTNNISVVTINLFSSEAIVEEFRKYIDKINNTSGLIIDVRNNDVGNSDYAIDITKHLVKEEYILTERCKTQTHNAAKKAWASINSYNPDNTYVKKYKEYFNTIQWETHLSDSVLIPPVTKKIKVPVVILTDSGMFSAAEDFLLYTNNDKTIKRIGMPSTGSLSQPLHINLFEQVHARICAKRDVMPNVTDYIGVGVQPHIKINENQITKL
jgi:C-terminal processing protease CtpA/Prc